MANAQFAHIARAQITGHTVGMLKILFHRETLEILPWSEACTRIYGRLRADLERHGKPLAVMDLLIASHALSEGCTLVTADQAFAHVDELTLEAW